MPFDIARLIRTRPFLYHLTARENVPSIIRDRELRCARLLLEGSDLSHQISARRSEHLRVTNREGRTLIRDQKPLIEKNIAFESGWNLARLVEHINEHVFFWPGGASGPIGPGLNHFERYRSEAPAILRLPTTAITKTGLRFSRYNSGAPRCSGGKHSPRGGGTYLPATEFSGNASDVIEVVTVHMCALPSGVEVSNCQVPAD